MKNLFLTFILFTFLSGVCAQESKPHNLPTFDYKRLHFGFTVGLNYMDMAFERNTAADNYLHADITDIQPGFQVSIVSDLRLGDDLTLRFLPGISFGARQISFYEQVGDDWVLASKGGADNPVRIGPAYLDFPLHLKYRARRDNNYRPYIVGGLNFRYDMAAQNTYDGESNEYIRVLPADVFIEAGFGLDTYLQYFKFAPEIKVAIGLRNILADDPRDPYPEFANSISSMKTYIIMLNFHFE